MTKKVPIRLGDLRINAAAATPTVTASARAARTAPASTVLEPQSRGKAPPGRHAHWHASRMPAPLFDQPPDMPAAAQLTLRGASNLCVEVWVVGAAGLRLAGPRTVMDRRDLQTVGMAIPNARYFFGRARLRGGRPMNILTAPLASAN